MALPRPLPPVLLAAAVGLHLQEPQAEGAVGRRPQQGLRQLVRLKAAAEARGLQGPRTAAAAAAACRLQERQAGAAAAAAAC